MGDFADYLGEYLDNTIIQLSKIASECEIFADQCVLNGFAPPHPGDLQRVLNEVNWSPKNPEDFSFLGFSQTTSDSNITNPLEINKSSSNDTPQNIQQNGSLTSESSISAVNNSDS